MSRNPQLQMTLDQAVGEVLTLLTGLDLHYIPELDRYRAITKLINRSLRSIALEREWSYYSDVETVGTAQAGQRAVNLRATVRPRIINDDAVRLVDADGNARVWAYFLPRDALHKYGSRGGLWASTTRSTILFSRPFHRGEDGLSIQVPVMREPRMLEVPPIRENIEDLTATPDPEDPDAATVQVRNFEMPDIVEEWVVDGSLPPYVVEDPESALAQTNLTPAEIRQQLIDFQYPDLVVLRAAYFYAQTDPVMQPRVQTIEAQYKDLMYQIIERDDRMTDSPYLNDFFVPVQGSLRGQSGQGHWHPHSDERL